YPARRRRPCEADTGHDAGVIGVDESTAVTSSPRRHERQVVGLSHRRVVAVDDEDRGVIRVDRRHLVVDLVDRLRIFIAKAKVECESWEHFPVVLDEITIATLATSDRTGDAAYALEACAIHEEIGCRI